MTFFTVDKRLDTGVSIEDISKTMTKAENLQDNFDRPKNRRNKVSANLKKTLFNNIQLYLFRTSWSFTDKVRPCYPDHR